MIDSRCNAPTLLFNNLPATQEPYFEDIAQIVDELIFVVREDQSLVIPGRPLFGVIPPGERNAQTNFTDRRREACNVENLRKQVQTAVELEWATIPTYLNSLFSIINGSIGPNAAIYNMIQEIVIEEMHHFNLAANILIALDGYPVIDAKNVTPQYPTTGLPGGVLVNLTVNLDKLTLEQAYYVFMGIEVPLETDVAGLLNCSGCFTIGLFYDEISDCLETLNSTGVQVFNSSTVSRQVTTRFPSTAITDTDSARDGIRLIVDQGEGVGPFDPFQVNGSDSSLAHFYRFEEVVCQKRLVNIDNVSYSYSGSPIPFNASGVYPVPKNFNITTVPSNSSCITAARNFHSQYRSMLTLLQASFNGNPSQINTAIAAMRNLTSLAEKAMKISINATDNCGVVWDYDFPLQLTAGSSRGPVEQSVLSLMFIFFSFCMYYYY